MHIIRQPSSLQRLNPAALRADLKKKKKKKKKKKR